LLAYLPTIAVVIGLFIANGDEAYSYTEAFALAVLPPLAAPLLVHASGRAIDATGPRAGEVLTFCSQRFLPLVAGYLLVTAPATFLSEALYIFAADENMLFDVVASLVYLPGMILGTVLTVEAFHRMPQKSPA
jgi:predicted Na+-dependent transporter